MRPSRTSLLSIASLSAVLLGLDLWMKYWAQTVLAQTPWQPLSWFELTYSENPGIAFGLPVGGLLLIALSVLLIGFFLYYLYRMLDLNRASGKIVASMILAGAVGNLYDRIAFGIVRDFVRIGWWPLFNLADALIVTGLLLLILNLYLPHGRKHSSR